jgi:type I restriction enzyme S subunit
MEEWKEYNLGDLVELKNGVAFKSSEFIESGIPVIKIKNVKPNKILLDDLSYVSEHSSQNKKCFDILPSDILITMTGNRKDGGPDSWVGKVALFGKSGRYLLNQRVSAIRVKRKDLVEYQYLAYLLSCWDAQLYFVNHSNSSGGQANISPDVVYGYNVTLPSLSEQTRIAAILSSLDDKIEVNRRINDNLEQQAQALFKSWFVDFEPFRDQPFVESELGMIPEGWSVGNIYEYIDVIYGAPYKSTLFNDNKDGLPLIRIRDLKTNAPQFYTPEVLPNTEYINAGDIVAGMDAEFIPYVWLGEKGVLNQRCCKFKGKNDAISNYYILFLIKPELEYVQSYKTGTTVSHLGKSDIDRFRFVTPPLEVIKSFSNTVDCMLKEVVNRSKESRRLAELRDTLLPRLMSGEIKVGDITL